MDGAEPGNQFHFPALWYSQGLVYMIDALDTMTQCTKTGFKSGFFKGALLIDCTYRKFEVVDARKLRTLFRLSIYDLLGILEANPRWQVELIFGPNPKKSSLDEVKELIFKSFRKEKYIWEEMTDFEEFRDKIAAASSMEAIWEIFKEFHQA